MGLFSQLGIHVARKQDPARFQFDNFQGDAAFVFVQPNGSACRQGGSTRTFVQLNHFIQTEWSGREVHADSVHFGAR